MTFIPADSLTFHCRKCSGTINESNLSSNVGSDPFMKPFQRCCRKQVALPRLACGDAPQQTAFINVITGTCAFPNAQRSNVCRGKRRPGLFALPLSEWISILWELCAVVWRCGDGHICMPHTATRLLLRDNWLNRTWTLAGVKLLDEAIVFFFLLITQTESAVMSLSVSPSHITLSVK